MVLFQLKGGLGNQMFCYAASLSFRKATGKEIAYDYESPYRYVQGVYSLGCFKAEIPFAGWYDLWKRKPKVKVERIFYEIMGWNSKKYLVNEVKEFSYDPTFFEIPDGAYVTGFWQAERYVAMAESEIREAFAYRDEPQGENVVRLQNIGSVQSISIHVRRADYVSIPATSALHGACSLEYYQQAIAFIEARVRDPFYFVFSDDLEWAKTNLQLGERVVFISGNSGRADFEDMRLMSNCKHHIIANSSFSWWGAWLNPDPSKIVVAPRRWMNDPAIDTTDLIPQSWVRL